jgi:subtilisin family serine protease
MKIIRVLVVLQFLFLLSCGKNSNSKPSANSTSSQNAPTEIEDFLSYMHKKVQDQTIIPDEIKHLADPIPELNTCGKDFKIKLAVIDTGIDYNSHFLRENILYNCTEDLEPVGFGRDDLGKDDWASPYLVRTDHLNPKMSVEQREESLRIQNKYNKLHQSLTDQELKNIISHHLVHDSHTTHGTKVAALASYSDDRIGIIGYRANLDPSQGYLNVARSIIKMIRKASKDGVKIINLSLGFPQIESNLLYSRVWEQAHKEFRAVIQENKNILFVAGAGNESKTLDFSSKPKSFPCGINLPNIICAGSINKDLNISTFSNVPINYRNVIYARGEDIDSIIPTKYCSLLSSNSLFESTLLQKNDNDLMEELFNHALGSIKKECQSKLEAATGTSFAAPLVSRESAKIWMDRPHYTPDQVISELLSRGESIRTNLDQDIKVLPFEMPSWLESFSD